MDYATPPTTAARPGPDASAPNGTCVLLVDAHSTRRAASAHHLCTILPGVNVTECADASTAMQQLATMKFALVVLDVASCDGRAMVVSQYWRLTEPNMQQILVHGDASLLSFLDLGKWHGIEHCLGDDVPAVLLAWARRYRQAGTPGSAARKIATNIPARVGQLRNVLLIDDDPFMLTVLGDMLRELGAQQITTATSGLAGIQAYDHAAQAPDVILCDLLMPNGNGFELLEQLSARDFGGGIIVVSSMAEQTRTSAALAAHFHRLNILAALCKPVDEMALRSALAQLDLPAQPL